MALVSTRRWADGYAALQAFRPRWHIELFFKELKSTLGLHHYRFKKFEKAETWVTLCL